MDTVEKVSEEGVEALFTAPREGDALDESLDFAELDETDDDETEREE